MSTRPPAAERSPGWDPLFTLPSGNADAHSERRFRAMVDAIPAAIYTTDAAGRLTHFNPACVAFSGRIPQLGTDHWCVTWKLFHPDGRPMPHDTCPMAVALKEGREIRGAEAIAERPDGSRIWFEPYPVPVLDAEGRVVGGINLLVDITERKRNEQHLVDARREAEAANQAKETFLAVLSHELRTPLAPILMAVSGLEGDAALPADVRSALGMIRRNVELESKLIDDLLDLSRISTGKLRLNFETLDLNDLIRQSCEAMRAGVEEKQIRLQLELAAALHPVSADPARLQQVISNLLGNPVKFTPAGGEIHVRSENVPGSRVRVTVRDTGIGIAPENLTSIFEAFEQGEADITRRFGGLGLGLAICKLLVEAHQGSIRAESAGLHQGSAFIFELPAVAGAKLTAPAPAAAMAGALRVLVVEDHADTAAMMKLVLRRAGHHVVVATSAAAALARARERQFDLVLCDLGLPDLSGYELMRRLGAEFGLAGIALSGYGAAEDVRRASEAGFSRHLAKPVDLEKLQKVMQEVAASLAPRVC